MGKRKRKHARLILDERTLKHFTTKSCEQCGKTGKVRAVKVYGVFGEDRGTAYLCFDCFSPRIHWADEENNHYWTPIDEPLPKEVAKQINA